MDGIVEIKAGSALFMRNELIYLLDMCQSDQ